MSSDAHLFEPPPPSLSANRNSAPIKLLVSLALFIFVAESITMTILYYLQLPSYLLNTLVDGGLMLLLIFPGLYYFQLKPILRKVKAQEQAEMALRTREAQLKKILETLPVGVWIVNQHGTITHANPAGQDIWAGIRYVGMEGYGEYKSRWASTGELVKPEEWAASRAIMRGEITIDDEINIEAFDGTAKVILVSAAPLFDEKNTLQGAVIVNQDITQRKKMEKEMARTHELMERFFNSIHTMTAFLDGGFNFVRVNQAYAEMGGHPVDFFTGKNHFDLYPHAENQTIFRQVLETGQPVIVYEKPFEYPEYPERGVTYWDWSLQPVKGPDHQVEGVVLSLLDVTRRKLAELKLEQQNRELLELSLTEHRQRVFAEGLAQSVIVLNTSLELEQVLRSILEQIRKVIPFQGTDILLVEGRTCQVASFLGFEDFPAVRLDPEIAYPLEAFPLLQQVCTTHQMLILDSAQSQAGWHLNPDTSWVRSFAAVPLIIEGRAMGIIELYSERPAAFDQDTSERLAAFAAPAALALHNARLYQAESEAHRLAETMRAAAQALSQTLDLEHVINTLLDYMRMIVSCDTSGLTLMEGEDRWTLRTLRGYNEYADQNDLPSVPPEEINIVLDIPIPHKVLIIPNKDFNAPPVNERIRSPIHTWAILPILVNEKVIGFVELGKAGKEIFRPEQMQWAEALVSEASVAIQNAWLFEQVRSSSVRLQSLARKLVELQEKERYHIARELHDEAGQLLSSLKLSLGQLEQDPDCPVHIGQRLGGMKNVADGVLEGLHRLAMDLRPVALDHLGLVPAVRQLANQLNCEGLAVKFKSLGIDDGERFPQDLETSLYRIVQEALTNVVNHARAHNVGILLERDNDKLKLFVEDDGIGFVPEAIEGDEHLGLVGMHERAEMFGGRLTIESTPGSGTSIIVEVPNADTYPHHG